MKTINWLLEQMLVNNYISKKGFKNADTWLIQEAIQEDEKEKNKFAIEFADWKDNLKPSQKVSFWSKDGQFRGKFDMDNEQLLEIYKQEKGL